MATFKTMPWSIGEVRTFLCLIADERIQRELEGATRNQKVYQEVSELLIVHGYQRTFQQCRVKLKKLKSDYRSIRYHNVRRSSSRRKSWKWFEKMDAIYGHRPASKGKGDLESLNQDQLYWPNVSISKEDPDDAPLVPAAMTTSDANTTPQQERSLQLAFENAVRARELETALRREQNAETAAFHQACLGTLRQLMQVFSGPHDPVSPEPVSAPTQATSSTTPQDVFTGRREQPLGEERLAVLREMLEVDEEQQELSRPQQERSLQLAFDDAVRARELEAALRREQNAETAAFHQACLGTLRQLMQVLSGRRDPVPPPLD
ncbi:uncharacterized protein LOC124485312 isoform X2 [Hypomesus transpacificus]|uniref:uncharacterized protein LOC124485312 isoform X2 n=1 Tax=Hypomesus transpacificus TaxID=137520 RepID=UPI001F082A1A|nr:uncharacterized protein LOC124485312 isoform X2 [Hypomesus transpacificus]